MSLVQSSTFGGFVPRRRFWRPKGCGPHRRLRPSVNRTDCRPSRRCRWPSARPIRKKRPNNFSSAIKCQANTALPTRTNNSRWSYKSVEEIKEWKTPAHPKPMAASRQMRRRRRGVDQGHAVVRHRKRRRGDQRVQLKSQKWVIIANIKKRI